MAGCCALPPDAAKAKPDAAPMTGAWRCQAGGLQHTQAFHMQVMCRIHSCLDDDAYLSTCHRPASAD